MTDEVRVGRAEASSKIWQWQSAEAKDRARRSLEQRAGILRGAVGGCFAAILFWLHRPITALVVAGLAGITLLLAVFSPTHAYPILSRGVELLARLVGIVLTYILLVPVFLLFFVPFGLLARRGKNDRLNRDFDRARASYWIGRGHETKPGSLEKPY
ncbi:MAG: hypothetical protein IPK60_01270 [Sandaracinaceae bacterium]|nr:hypothetical protein [Sandaracinaceae bacterium]